MIRPRIDHQTSTVDGAAAFEHWRAEDEYEDDRPTRGELGDD